MSDTDNQDIKDFEEQLDALMNERERKEHRDKAQKETFDWELFYRSLAR